MYKKQSSAALLHINHKVKKELITILLIAQSFFIIQYTPLEMG